MRCSRVRRLDRVALSDAREFALVAVGRHLTAAVRACPALACLLRVVLRVMRGDDVTVLLLDVPALAVGNDVDIGIPIFYPGRPARNDSGDREGTPATGPVPELGVAVGAASHATRDHAMSHQPLMLERSILERGPGAAQNRHELPGPRRSALKRRVLGHSVLSTLDSCPTTELGCSESGVSDGTSG